MVAFLACLFYFGSWCYYGFMIGLLESESILEVGLLSFCLCGWVLVVCKLVSLSVCVCLCDLVWLLWFM